MFPGLFICGPCEVSQNVRVANLQRPVTTDGLDQRRERSVAQAWIPPADPFVSFHCPLNRACRCVAFSASESFGSLCIASIRFINSSCSMLDHELGRSLNSMCPVNESDHDLITPHHLSLPNWKICNICRQTKQTHPRLDKQGRPAVCRPLLRESRR